MPTFILRPPARALSVDLALLAAAHELRTTELACLRATYGEDLRESSCDTIVSLHLSANLLQLSLRLPPTYPIAAPIVEVTLTPPGAIPQLQMFELEERLQDIIQTPSESSIDVLRFEETAGRLCESVREVAAEWRGDDFDDSHSWDCMCQECIPTYLKGQVVDDYNIGYPYDNGARNFINSCLLPKYSMDNLAQLFHHTSKILHSEPVARPHLIARFTAKRELLRKLAVQETRSKGRRAMDKRVDDLTRIEIVFHGTPRRNVDAIVRGGFAIPGTGKNVNGEQVVVRCGSTWGRGVAGPLFDSHVSPSGLEWIVFDPAQIVPLLVLHMGSQGDADSLKSLISGKVESRGREEGEDSSGRVRRLSALARKSLPFGFGPAGRGFVVEEIGEVDEDDDQYGEYRAATLGGEYAWRLNEFTQPNL